MNRQDVESQISYLQNKSDEALIDIVGAYALSQEAANLEQSLALNGFVNVTQIKDSAKQYLSKLTPILIDTVCGPDGIVSYADNATVKDIVSVVVAALGYSTLGAVPTAIIAIGIILSRSGLREFCRNSGKLMT